MEDGMIMIAPILIHQGTVKSKTSSYSEGHHICSPITCFAFWKDGMLAVSLIAWHFEGHSNCPVRACFTFKSTTCHLCHKVLSSWRSQFLFTHSLLSFWKSPYRCVGACFAFCRSPHLLHSSFYSAFCRLPCLLHHSLLTFLRNFT